ncbi:MAG: nitrile hydratase subunit alpha [Halieaceae bacterium]|jgi:nitrile hydratase|nr:nitrile hydratase subunit alpha [Halieaceae bacterium]
MSTRKTATPAAQAAAVKSALLEKGHLSDAHFDAAHAIEESLKWHNGARVVARAWSDPDFKARLMQDGTAACAELGFAGPEGEYIVVIEDTPEQKNAVVCTQCSCTAWPVLGLPPEWYKSPAYRARVVREPRKVLSEMGLDMPQNVALRIWDTTAETRYLVLPLRPPGTDDWSEDQLAAIVTRESMIGVALVVAEH